MLRWLKTVVVSDVEKAHVMRQVGIGKTVRSPRFSGIAVDVSLLNQVASKPGCSRSARDESGGCPCFWPGGVRHVGDVSPVCCSCMERGKACPDTAVRLVAEGEREPAKRLNREAVSTVAGRAGGPARSSCEAPAGRGGGGAKGPGHLWCVR